MKPGWFICGGTTWLLSSFGLLLVCFVSMFAFIWRWFGGMLDDLSSPRLIHFFEVMWLEKEPECENLLPQLEQLNGYNEKRKIFKNELWIHFLNNLAKKKEQSLLLIFTRIFLNLFCHNSVSRAKFPKMELFGHSLHFLIFRLNMKKWQFYLFARMYAKMLL